MTCARCNHTAKKFGRYGKARIQRYRCTSCSATFSDPKPESPLGTMRTELDAAARAIQCLIEGCSIRTTERLTGLNRNTIMRLLVVAGERCQKLMDEKMRNLPCQRIQCDELWTFVAKKQRHVRSGDPAEFGDAWIFVAMDADSKIVPSFVVGKRTAMTTNKLIGDLAKRLRHRVQLTSDGFRFYVNAIEQHFGANVDFAQCVKLFGDYGQHGESRA